jgi:imidazolonepropionase-like amidohydrolase
MRRRGYLRKKLAGMIRRAGTITKRLRWLAWVVLAGLLLLPRATAEEQPRPVVIRGCSVLDVASGMMNAGRTVILDEGRIRAIGTPTNPVEAPPGATIIAAGGKFLIPGLIDAHVHLVHILDSCRMTGDEILPLFATAGVTSVRDTGDEIVAETLVSRFAESFPEKAPRVFRCSPLIDRDPPFHRDIGRAVTDVARVPEFVDEMAGWGVTSLKIYVGTPREIGRAVVIEGHKRGLRVAGHLGAYAAQDAVADGIDVLEHIWSVFNYIIPPEESSRPNHRSTLDLDNPKAKALIAALARKRTFVDPTLVVFRNMILLHDQPAYSGHPDCGTVPARLFRHWNAYKARSNLLPETLAARRGEFRKYQQLTGALHRAGVPLLAGTDAPEPFVPPGFSLHQELELLVESGLSPAEALRCATLQNARAIGQADRLGTIEPGKLADLVLLDANPVESIANTRAISKVFRGGLVLEPRNLLKDVPKD